MNIHNRWVQSCCIVTCPLLGYSNTQHTVMFTVKMQRITNIKISACTFIRSYFMKIILRLVINHIEHRVEKYDIDFRCWPSPTSISSLHRIIHRITFFQQLARNSLATRSLSIPKMPGLYRSHPVIPSRNSDSYLGQSVYKYNFKYLQWVCIIDANSTGLWIVWLKNGVHFTIWSI